MAVFQGRSKRKNTGGLFRDFRKDRQHALGKRHLGLTIGEKRIQLVRGLGGSIKRRALKLTEVNVFDPKSKKYSKSEVVSVSKNSANPHFIRRNTITKGAIIETKAGLARVTNRPGQDGSINAILVEQ